MSAPRGTEWPAEKYLRLRALWLEGRPPAEIGRLLGISTGAAIAKVYRSDLPRRGPPVGTNAGPWTDDVVGRLRALWLEGCTMAEIGLRLGMTKNAVIGRVHRSDLPPRPSPIHASADPPPPAAPAPVTGPTLPPLASLADAPIAAPAAVPPGVSARSVARTSAGSRPTVVFRPVLYGRVVECCWPIGEPGTPGFRFCEDASEPGRPYCAVHAARAYVRVRERGEDYVERRVGNG